MKKLIIFAAGFLLFSGFSLSSYAAGPAEDNSSNSRNFTTRDSSSNAKYAKIKQMLETHDFVLEADFLANQMGDRIPVTSNLNFISVDSTHAVIQIGRTTGIGYNGVGGVTAEGSIGRYDLKLDNKHNSFYLSFNVTTILGNYDINMTVSGDGYSNATLTGIWGGQLTYSGYLVPIEDSRVYKGYNSY